MRVRVRICKAVCCASIGVHAVVVVALRAAVSTPEFLELVSFRARVRGVGREY